MSGRLIPVMVNPTVVIAAAPTAKLRSRNSLSGRSGSPRCTRCHHTNTMSTMAPVTIMPHTLMGPQMMPQSNVSPS